MNSMWAAAEACAAGLADRCWGTIFARRFPLVPVKPPIAELEMRDMDAVPSGPPRHAARALFRRKLAGRSSRHYCGVRAGPK